MKRLIGLALVVVSALVFVSAILGLVFTFPVSTSLARALGSDGALNGAAWPALWANGGWGNGPGFGLPPVLQGLASIPADQRFDHFRGAQLDLLDQNNQPLTVQLIPGRVSAASASSLTIAANRGGSQTFALDQATVIHAMPASTASPTATPAAPDALPQGDRVVVITLNDSATAAAVFAAGPTGFAWPAQWGRWAK